LARLLIRFFGACSHPDFSCVFIDFLWLVDCGFWR
jgi:hypothetical protein